MSQSKVHSLLEQIANIAVGIVIALASQMVFFHYFDIQISTSDNVLLVAWLTVVSVVRGYLLRRFFNKLQGK